MRVRVTHKSSLYSKRKELPSMVGECIKRKGYTVNPKIARALVNLSGVKDKELFLDPFCGTGGILIEACMVGARIIGADVQDKMVKQEEKQSLYQIHLLFCIFTISTVSSSSEGMPTGCIKV